MNYRERNAEAGEGLEGDASAARAKNLFGRFLTPVIPVLTVKNQALLVKARLPACSPASSRNTGRADVETEPTWFESQFFPLRACPLPPSEKSLILKTTKYCRKSCAASQMLKGKRGKGSVFVLKKRERKPPPHPRRLIG